MKLEKSRGLFKKSLYAIFFSETNPESPFQHQHGIKKKPKENGFLRKRL